MYKGRRLPRNRAWCAVLLAVTMLSAGCGSSDSATRTVVTVIQQAPPVETSKAPSSPPPAASVDDGESDAAGTVSDEGSGGGSSGGKLTVPDEVGKQHQAAQDDLQAHGLFNLAEEDATGQGRMLIIDRNWKVVSQSPAAGTKVSEDGVITLRSKKYTDP